MSKFCQVNIKKYFFAVQFVKQINKIILNFKAFMNYKELKIVLNKNFQKIKIFSIN